MTLSSLTSVVVKTEMLSCGGNRAMSGLITSIEYHLKRIYQIRGSPKNGTTPVVPFFV
jgi:hypothetical protein